MKQNKTLRVFAAYLVGFFLILAMLTAFIVIPNVNDVVQQQHERDASETLQIESELLRRHIRAQAQTLKDLASFPVVTNAVLLSSTEDQNFIDLMDNFTIAGEATPLVLQDIVGGVIYRTKAASRGVYGNLNPIIGRLMDGRKAFGLELLPSKQGVLTYKLSVPVLYQDSIEGILSAEMKVEINKIFSPQLFEEKTSFIIRQGSLRAETPTDQISLPEEFKQRLTDLDVELVFIRDRSKLNAEQNKLRNTILLVLLGAMGLSFAAFMILGYRSLSAEDSKTSNFKKETLGLPVGMGSLGLAIAILASYFTFDYQVEKERENLILRNTEELREVENRLLRKVNLMNMLTGLFESSDQVTREEFDKFTTQILRGYEDVRTLKWVPYVSDQSRLLFESHGREAGLFGFEIQQRGEGGKLRRAGRREGYFPIFYVTPKSNHTHILGFDQASEKLRRNAILRAKSENRLVATGLLRPIMQPKADPEITIYSPVSRQAAQNKLHFVGVVSGTFLISDIVRNSLGVRADNTLIRIEDVTDGNNKQCVLCAGDNYVTDKSYSTTRMTNIGGRLWKLTAYPSTERARKKNFTWPLLIFSAISAMSLLVAYTFWQLVRRRQIVEAQVEERTTEVRELSEAMEKTVEGVSRIDPQGRYTYVNEAYASTCGYVPAELVGEEWTMTVHEDDHGMMKKEYKTMLETGYVTAEPRGVRKDGSVFYKRVTMTSRHDDQGTFIGHHCFMTDISERKQAEIELLRSNRDLDDFAYIASHDLKEPLRGIHNHAKLYVEDYADKIDEEGKHRLSRITYLSQRMESLINDLLYYSRLGRQGPEFEKVDLFDLVVQEQKLLSDNESVAITLTDRLPTIRCDKQRVAELYRNLIANAIKYNDNKLKKIAIGMEIDETKGRGNVPIFFVKDNGIGIDARFHKDIFKIFKRLHKKDAYGGGTGSGLTFAQKIVAQHNGEIWVESELGKGSAFYFTLGKTEV